MYEVVSLRIIRKELLFFGGFGGRGVGSRERSSRNGIKGWILDSF